jgi:hypothetical protein
MYFGLNKKEITVSISLMLLELIKIYENQKKWLDKY